MYIVNAEDYRWYFEHDCVIYKTGFEFLRSVLTFSMLVYVAVEVYL